MEDCEQPFLATFFVIFYTSMHRGYAYATFYEYQDQIPPEASLQSNKSVAFFVIYLTCPGIHAVE